MIVHDRAVKVDTLKWSECEWETSGTLHSVNEPSRCFDSTRHANLDREHENERVKKHVYCNQSGKVKSIRKHLQSIESPATKLFSLSLSHFTPNFLELGFEVKR